jgi:hypothetical protein
MNAAPGTIGVRSCILIGMQESTTLRVSRATRDAVRELADDDGVSLDEEIRRLARSERQRRLGVALRAAEPTAEDERWLRMAAGTVRDDAGR